MINICNEELNNAKELLIESYKLRLKRYDKDSINNKLFKPIYIKD